MPAGDWTLFERFLPLPLDDKYYHDIDRERALIIKTLEPGWLGRKTTRESIKAAFVHVTPFLTKREIAAVYRTLLAHPVYNLMPGSKTKTLKRVVEHLFVCSLRNVQASVVMTALPHAYLARDLDEFVWEEKRLVPKAKCDGYSEVYEVGHGVFYLGNLKKSPYRRPRPNTKLQNNSLRDERNREIGTVGEISRHVHIHIFDAIRHEDEFAKLFANAIKITESEFS